MVAASLAVVLASLVVAAAHVRVSVDQDPASLTIPRVRDGESGTYAFFSSDDDLLGWMQFRIRGDAVSTATDGAPVPSVMVDYELTEGDTKATISEAVSRATGTQLVRTVGSGADGFEEVITEYGKASPSLPGLEWQEAAIRDGTVKHVVDGGGDQSVTWWRNADATPKAVHLGAADGSPCDVTETTTGRQGLADGVDVVELRQAWNCDGTSYTRSLWFAEDRALPLVGEYREARPDGVNDTLTLSLVDHVPGSGAPLGWQPAPADRPGRDLAFSSDGTPPLATGGGGFAYPLEEAAADATGSSELLAFRVWLQQHPDAVLASARLMRGEHSTRDVDSDTWRLVYAAPSGAGYEVALERFVASGEKQASDRGGITIEAFEPEEIPDRLVTLSAAAHEWRRLASGKYADLRVNHVQWGIPVALSWASDCPEPPPPTGLLPRETDFATLVVGHSTYGTCVDPKITRYESYLTAGADSGTPDSLVEHQVELAAFTSRDVPRQGPSQVSTETSGLTFRAPDLQVAAVVSGSLLTLLWVAYFYPTLKMLAARGLGWLTGYSRVQGDEVLDHETRQAILDACRNDPGVTASELATRVGIAWGTLSHHVEVLEREEFVTSLRNGRHRHFFPAGEETSTEQRIRALLRGGNTRKVYDVVRRRPGLSLDALAESMDMTPAGALWHVRLLEDVGLLQRRREGRNVACFEGAAAPLGFDK